MFYSVLLDTFILCLIYKINLHTIVLIYNALCETIFFLKILVENEDVLIGIVICTLIIPTSCQIHYDGKWWFGLLTTVIF